MWPESTTRARFLDFRFETARLSLSRYGVAFAAVTPSRISGLPPILPSTPDRVLAGLGLFGPVSGFFKFVLFRSCSGFIPVLWGFLEADTPSSVVFAQPLTFTVSTPSTQFGVCTTRLSLLQILQPSLLLRCWACHAFYPIGFRVLSTVTVAPPCGRYSLGKEHNDETETGHSETLTGIEQIRAPHSYAVKTRVWLPAETLEVRERVETSTKIREHQQASARTSKILCGNLMASLGSRELGGTGAGEYRFRHFEP